MWICFFFFTSAIHCMLLCPIPRPPLKIHDTSDQHLPIKLKNYPLVRSWTDIFSCARLQWLTDSFLHHQQVSERSSDCDMRHRCNPTNIPQCKFTPATRALPGVLLGNNHFSTEIVKTRGKPTMEQGGILGKLWHRLKLFEWEDNGTWAPPFSH